MSASVLINRYCSADMHVQGAHDSTLWDLNAAIQRLHKLFCFQFAVVALVE